MFKSWIEKIVGEWLIKKGLAKATKSATAAAIGYIAALLSHQQVQVWLANLGITIDPVQLEGGITLAVTGAITFLLNWAKVRFKLKFLG